MSDDYRIETKSDGKTYVTDVRREKAEQEKQQEAGMKMMGVMLVFCLQALKFLLWDISYISAFILSLLSLKRFFDPGIWAKLLGIAGCAGLILIPYSFKKYKDWLRPIGLTVCLVLLVLFGRANKIWNEQQQAELVVYQAKQAEDRRISQAHEQAKQEENRRISEAQEQAKLLADREAQKKADEIREAKELADRKAQKEADEIREAKLLADRKAQKEAAEIREVKRLAEQEGAQKKYTAILQAQQEENEQRAASAQAEYKAREATRQAENKARGEENERRAAKREAEKKAFQEKFKQRAAINKAEAESLHRR